MAAINPNAVRNISIRSLESKAKVHEKLIVIVPKTENTISARITNASTATRYNLPLNRKVHLLPFSRLRIFSRIASIINSERLRYAISGRFRIVSSIRSINSSGIETVVYSRTMSPLYICDKLGFLSDEHGIYHNHYMYGRYK